MNITCSITPPNVLGCRSPVTTSVPYSSAPVIVDEKSVKRQFGTLNLLPVYIYELSGSLAVSFGRNVPI